jgi:ABC-2 type transport system permease protein
MNIAFTPFGWEYRIREGELNSALLRPIHPIHFDLAYFSGWKFVVILMWLPIAVLLTLIFQPTFNLSWWSILIFLVAIWGGFLIRFFLLWALGMITFWTTRVGAFFDLYFTMELLLSGRFVPLSLMPGWVQTIANWLPFKYAFGYPIEVLAGQQSPESALLGLGIQVIWIVVGIGITRVTWRLAMRAYSAVGG